MPIISGTVFDASGNPVAGRIVRAYRRDTGGLLAETLSSDGSSSPDPHWDKVALLLHMDGVDGSTNFNDSSPRAKAITASGNAKVSSAQSKWGGASLALDGSGDYLSAPAHADFVFGGGDFTVELFINTATAEEKVLVDQYQSGNDNSWQLGIKNGRLFWYSGGYILTGATAVNDFAWHHVAAARSAGTLRFFVDGVLNGSVALGHNYNTNLVLGIGAQITSRNSAYDFLGYIDEVRITKGVGRYTENFTPPTAPFPETATPLPLGKYEITTTYTGECNVICLDDSEGTTYNDLILRTIPA